MSISAARPCDADGWFPTNDGGCARRGRLLYVSGRLDDVIVRGGENISPGEIERRCSAHPVVCGGGGGRRAGRGMGRGVVVAVVVDRAASVDRCGAAEWVRARLRSTKTPEQIQFRAELPYSETGKLLRRQLKSELANLLRWRPAADCRGEARRDVRR